MSRIGILQCDSVRPEFIGQHGDYPQMLQSLLEPLAPGTGFDVFDVEHGVYPDTLQSCDAYLVTGSRASVFDPEPWIASLESFVRDVYAARIPIVGVCFGHQLLARALGGHVERSPRGWGVGVRTVAVEQTRDWMRPAMRQFNLVYSHRDQVVTLPERARRLAGDEFCPNALFELDGLVLGCQGHPEFSTAYADCLLDLRAEMIGESVVDRARRSFALGTHYRQIAAWMLRFAGVRLTTEVPEPQDAA